jgi:hypothetical protein
MPEYEFNKEQSKVIKAVATKCVVEAILIMLIGIFGIIGPLIILSTISTGMAIAMIIQSILFVAIGAAFYPPYTSLKKVAETEGSDITDLMKGIRKLSTLFKLLIFFILGSIICDVIMIVLS